MTAAAAEPRSLRARLLSGGLFSLAGAVLGRGSSLVLSYALAWLLGREAFGAYGMVQGTVGLFAVFAGFGLGVSASREIAALRRADPARAGRVLGLLSLASVASAALLATVLVLLAPWLAVDRLHDPSLVGPLRASALFLALQALAGAQQGALSGFEAFRPMAIAQAFGGAATLGLGALGAWLWGTAGALFGVGAGQAVIVLLQQVALSRAAAEHGVPLRLEGAARELAVLSGSALPALVSAVVSMPVVWWTTAALYTGPDGAAQSAIFAAANQWRAVLLFVPTVFGQFVTPIIAERLAGGARAEANLTLKLAMVIAAAVALPVGVALAAASPLVMAGYGPGFREGWPVLALIVATGALLAVQTPVGAAIAGAGRFWLGAAMNAGWAAAMLAAALWLQPWGALGLAGAYLVSYVVHSIWAFGWAARVLRDDRR